MVVLALCERFGCLPSALLAEDVELFRLLGLEAIGRQQADRSAAAYAQRMGDEAWP